MERIDCPKLNKSVELDIEYIEHESSQNSSGTDARKPVAIRECSLMEECGVAQKVERSTNINWDICPVMSNLARYF